MLFAILFILLIPVYFFSTCRRKILGGLVFTVHRAALAKVLDA